MTLQNFTLGTFSQGAAGGGAAFESIASASGTGSSATITFSSIPATYQHLQIRGIARTIGSFNERDIFIQLNTSTTDRYHYLAGDGASAYAGSSTNANGTYCLVATGANASANIMGAVIIDIHDYASTTKNKTVRAFGGNDRNGAGTIMLHSGFKASTSAVTSITLTAPDSFATTTTFALYGIKS